MVKILIVDDDLDYAITVKDDLEDVLTDCEFILKNSGFSAFQYINSHKVDFLISDIAMPDMNGYDLYKRVKSTRPHVEVFLMTAFGYDPDHVIVNCKREGLEKVFMKPFNVDILANIINEKIEKL